MGKAIGSSTFQMRKITNSKTQMALLMHYMKYDYEDKFTSLNMFSEFTLCIVKKKTGFCIMTIVHRNTMPFPLQWSVYKGMPNFNFKEEESWYCKKDLIFGNSQIKCCDACLAILSRVPALIKTDKQHKEKRQVLGTGPILSPKALAAMVAAISGK